MARHIKKIVISPDNDRAIDLLRDLKVMKNELVNKLRKENLAVKAKAKKDL